MSSKILMLMTDLPVINQYGKKEIHYLIKMLIMVMDNLYIEVKVQLTIQSI